MLGGFISCILGGYIMYIRKVISCMLGAGGGGGASYNILEVISQKLGES